MNFRLRIFTLSIILLICQIGLFSQGININIQNVDSLNNSDTTNLVYDINGEICNMVIVKTDIDSIKFYSNRGIEKISKTNDYYKIWVPAGSTVLKISVPGIPIYELQLPKSAFTNFVCEMILQAKVEKRIVYENPAFPSLSVSTEPANAKFFIYDVYVGKTPIVTSVFNNQIINYKIKKPRYLTKIGTDTMKLTGNKINLTFEDASRSKCLLFLLTYSVGPTKYFPEASMLYGVPGISIGSIGGTGYYASLKYNNPNDVERYTDLSDHPLEIKNFEITGGVTQQLWRYAFLKVGAGYTERKFTPITYDIYDKYGNNTYNTATATNSQGFAIDMGLIFRFAWNYLFLVNCTIDYAKPVDTSGKKTVYEFGIGLGFSLPLE